MIELWWGLLDIAERDVRDRWATLSLDELDRARRYVQARDRRRFAAGRGMLRAILGERLGLPARDVPLTTGEWGKPLIDGHDDRLCFNVAHSGPVLVVAVRDGAPVGVDLELAADDPGDADVAARFFSPAEQAALADLAPADYGAAFLRIWTRKEAWIKATGRGLSTPLASFDVSIEPGDARLLRIEGEADGGARWTMVDLSSRRFGLDVIGALAFAGADAVTVRPWCDDVAARQTCVVRA